MTKKLKTLLEGVAKKCCHPDCFNCPYDDCVIPSNVGMNEESKDITRQVKYMAELQENCMNGNGRRYAYTLLMSGRISQYEYDNLSKDIEYFEN